MIIYTKINKRADELDKGRKIWSKKLDSKRLALLDAVIDCAKEQVDGFTTANVIYCVDYVVLQCKNKTDFAKVYPQFNECLLSIKIDNDGEDWEKVERITKVYGLKPYSKGKSIADIGKSSGGWYAFNIDRSIVTNKKNALRELFRTAYKHNMPSNKNIVGKKIQDTQQKQAFTNNQNASYSPMKRVLIDSNSGDVISLPAASEHKINAQDLVGKRVNHAAKYGNGSIVDYDSDQNTDYVCIKFDNEADIKKYIYPKGFDQFITIIESESDELPAQSRQEQVNIISKTEDIAAKPHIEPEKTVDIQSAPRLLFTKTVDWSLLHYGFTVPQQHIETFYKVLGMQLSSINPRNNLTLIINKSAYHVKVYWSNGVTQVRWTPNDKIAMKLRSIFYRSYDYLRKQREFSKRNKTYNYGRKPVEFLDIMTDGLAGQFCLVPSMPGNKEDSSVINDAAEISSQFTGIQTSLYPSQQSNTEASSFDSESIASKMRANQRTEQNSNKNDGLVGQRVRLIRGHKEGTITKHILNYVSVTFDVDKKTRLFSYPYSIGRYIEYIDTVVTENTVVKEDDKHTAADIRQLSVSSESLPADKEDNQSSLTKPYTQSGNKREKLVGRRVRHTISHKEGTIVEHEYNFMFVVYDSDTVKHCFPYPGSIGKYLELLDNSAIKPTEYIEHVQSDVTRASDYKQQFITSDYKGTISPKIKHIITEKFKNGYRISRNTDFERFTNYYVEEYGEKPNLDAKVLDRSLIKDAVLFDERAYLYDNETIKTVRECLNQVGSPCISIQSFYENSSDTLYKLGIYSEEMLRSFIEKYYSDISCKYNYIYLQSDTTPTDIIRNAFSEREIWSLDELFERFPHFNQDTIRQMMTRNEFIRIETGVYTHSSHLALPYNEGQKIIDYIEEKLNTNDFILANELDLTHFLNLNPHCSYDAMRDIVFDKFLSGLFSKSGQIITRPGKVIKTLDILEQYCRESDTVSLDELTSLEVSLDSKGRGHSACLAAANNIMVRVSSDLFVKESMVDFDVDGIDEIIALYCPGNFIPLKSVTDFSLFPFTGYSWNLFLLESFVRRYSRLFNYDVRADNSSNVGVIVRKSFIYDDYDDILSNALANATLSLHDKKAILDFMYDKGFIARRILGNSEDKIISNAIKLREEASA